LINHVALFAGMGGFSVGLEPLGVTTSLANDIEPDCVQTLEKNRLAKEVVGASIEDSHWFGKGQLDGQIDILSAGFPCQPFSIAGNKDGFQDQKRGNLFFNILDFCASQELPPKVLFLENVTNLVINNGGTWLAAILNALRKAGYWVSKANCHIINSSKVTSTIQNRERVYIVAYHRSAFRRNSYKLPALKSKDVSKLDHFVDVKAKQNDSLYLSEDNKYFRSISAAASQKGCKKRLFQLRRTEVRVLPKDLCPTLTANMGMGGHNVPFLFDDHGLRRLSVEECASLQGFDIDNFSFPPGMSDGRKLKMIGNAVDPQVVQWLGASIIKDLETL
jgi:DNA (cytosine-5)-methyltransferase 1